MKNVVITGATSFIGIYLIRALLEKDYNIIAVVRRNSNNIAKLPKSKKIKIVELDMNETNKLHECISEECNIFVHLAWNGTRGSTRDDVELQKSNYEYSIQAIDEAHKMGCQIFVGAGSQAEYGLYNCVVSESTECRPVTEYGKQKLRNCNDGYELCKKYGMKFKWPRFFSLYGVNDYDGTMLISAIDKMLLNQDVNLTECIQLWNFLYITDAVDGMIRLIETECVDGPYNFGSNDTRQLKSFIEELYNITRTKSKIIYGAIPYPSTGMVSVNPDISKLKTETKWEPEVSFKEGIEMVIESRKQKLEVK
jgi:nucleoside-diphosphate-sugar epimerase